MSVVFAPSPVAGEALLFLPRCELQCSAKEIALFRTYFPRFRVLAGQLCRAAPSDAGRSGGGGDAGFL